MSLVPPNLRAFITPSVRRVYLDTPDRSAATSEKTAGKETGATPSTSLSSSQASEISRLQAENVALRTSCAMWRRRAELHGSANLGLLNFAKMVRDQASNLAREREELQNCCLLLKRRLDEIERFVFRSAMIATGIDTSGYSVTASKRAAPSQSESVSTPRPLKGLPSRCPSKYSRRASLASPSVASSSGILEPSRKRIKTEHDSSPTYLTDGSLVTGRAMLLPHLPVAHHRPSS